MEASSTEPDEPLSGLEVFVSLQRHLAAANFNSLAAAQRAIKQSAALPDFAATQVAVMESFARSIDFASLTAPLKSLGADAERLGAVAKQLSDSVSNAINLPALRDALAANSGLIELFESGRALAGLTRQREVFRRFTESNTVSLAKIDLARWIDKGDRWIPANLRSVTGKGGGMAEVLDRGDWPCRVAAGFWSPIPDRVRRNGGMVG